MYVTQVLSKHTGLPTHSRVRALKQISYAAEISDSNTLGSHDKEIIVSDHTRALKFWGGPGGAT